MANFLVCHFFYYQYIRKNIENLRKYNKIDIKNAYI